MPHFNRSISMSSILLGLYLALAPFEYVLASDEGTVARYVGLLYLPVAAFEIYRSRQQLSLGDPLVLPAILLVLLTWCSVLWSQDVGVSMNRSVVHTFLPFMYLAARWRGISERERKYIDRAILVGAWIAFLWLLVADPDLILEGTGRLSVTESSDPNNLAALFILPLFVSLTAFLRSNPCRRLLYGGSLAAFLFVVFMSGSRGALVGLGVAVLVMAIFGARDWGLIKAFAMVGGSFALVIVAAMLLPDVISDRLFGKGAFMRDINADGARADIWGVVWENVLPATAPWGYGSGMAPYVLQDWFGQPKGVHNTYLTLLVEYGILGLPLVLVMIWALLKTARRESVVVLGCLVTLLVISFFLDAYAKKFLWNILMYVAIASRPHEPDFYRVTSEQTLVQGRSLRW